MKEIFMKNYRRQKYVMFEIKTELDQKSKRYVRTAITARGTTERLHRLRMCYGSGRFPSEDDIFEIRPAENQNLAMVDDLMARLAETEARLERARAREAELSHQLDEMKRFVRVMEIIETYLRRRCREQRDQLARLRSYSSVLVSSE
ncbi:protein SKIP34 [Henckelia pumila]|uniref:protein SKIP34 n=1 Tax=Henckelia pumila TaxID=405737 RepID=UPI003C6E1271